MMKQCVRWLMSAAVVVAVAVPAMAQRSSPRRDGGQAAPQTPEAPKPLTRADKARKLFSDATSLTQTGRGLEGAAMFESMAKQYPTNENVPEALARAINSYYASQEPKAQALIDVMRKRFPNNQYTVAAYWRPVQVKCHRDSKAPLDEQIRLLEIYLDRYWAQAHFYEAIEMLARALLRTGNVRELDALLSHALAETSAESTGNMINMIQRACGGRKDFANMAKVYGEAARNMDAKKEPAAMAVRLLEISYLRRAGLLEDEDKKDEAKVAAAAKSLHEALKKTEQIIRERPKSEHAAYCALQMKPAILADQGDPAGAAAALRSALETFGIFALKRHWEKLADYETAAGNLQAAIEILTRRIAEPDWPNKQEGLLRARHDLQVKAGDLDGANATNKEIIQLLPGTRVAVYAELRIVSNLLVAERFAEAQEALSAVMKAYPGDADLAAMVLGYVNRFSSVNRPDELKPLRDQFLARYPASAQADEVRKALGQPVADTPTAAAQALFDEYLSFAKESNVDAARRRIDRLFKEFPSSGHGAAAAAQLSDALKNAGKVELHAELNLLIAEQCPYYSWAEARLKDAASAYNGASRPEEAMKAYRRLVKDFRFSQDWNGYVPWAAGTLDSLGKLPEAQALIDEAARPLGASPEATDLRAYMVRRLERQETWGEAADQMLQLLGTNAANPAYRPLIAEAYRFLAVAANGDKAYRDKEAKLLADLATRYEGWDEADRIRISLAGTYARMRDDANAGKAIRLIEAIQKGHPNYELGASGHGMLAHLSKYSRGLYGGTVGRHPVDRVSDDMSGGWGNYLYAHVAEDMIDYTLLLNKPQAYVDRLKQQLARLVKSKPDRPRNYKSGLPYRTKNVPRPAWHPWPEQRRIYGLVNRIDDGMRRLEPGQRIDPALWLEVYPLWPHHYMNDERMRSAATSLCGRDKARFQKALAILQKEYNPLVWEPYVLAAQARHERYSGAASKAIALYRAIIAKYRDHTVADGAAAAIKDMGGR